MPPCRVLPSSSTPSSTPTSARAPAGACPTWPTPTSRRASGCSRCGPRMPRRVTCSRGPRPSPELAGEAWVIVNDRVDVALVAGTRHVHLGQDDLPVADARTLLGPSAVIGLSTHTPDQIDAACACAGRLRRGRAGVRHADQGHGYDAVGIALRRRGAPPARRARRPAARGHRRHHARHGAGRPRGRGVGAWPSSAICCTEPARGARAAGLCASDCSRV